MSVELSSLERLLKRDRQIVVVALVSVIAFTSLYTISGVGMGMNAFEISYMPRMGYMYVLLAMWWIMMVAMMLPSAAPIILLTAALNRRSTSAQPPYGATAFFTVGYLLAWFFFSLVAVAGQLVLESNGLLSFKMQSNSTYLTAALLLAAGVWQFSPIKQACLRYCRSPVEFITRHRRPGNHGALMMGLHHGTYCLGCCWFLMALLFAGGVMNLYWIAGLALFVVVEKLYSHGVWFGRLTGAGFVITGIMLLVL
jgi:predicted metal-binding membrane protein